MMLTSSTLNTKDSPIPQAANIKFVMLKHKILLSVCLIEVSWVHVSPWEYLWVVIHRSLIFVTTVQRMSLYWGTLVHYQLYLLELPISISESKFIESFHSPLISNEVSTSLYTYPSRLFGITLSVRSQPSQFYTFESTHHTVWFCIHCSPLSQSPIWWLRSLIKIKILTMSIQIEVPLSMRRQQYT